jgi:hypothetical protein
MEVIEVTTLPSMLCSVSIGADRPETLPASPGKCECCGRAMGNSDLDSLKKRVKNALQTIVKCLPVHLVLSDLNSVQILQPFAESCD